jgi:choline dehydrogenase-like flavoprotein
MVYKVLMDPVKHRARGVLYIDRVTREPKEVQAKVVVLCAQALESARILLNSATEQAPNGLANGSGALGHYLMDHLWVAGGATGEFPELARYDKPSASAPDRPTGTYLIRFRNPKNGAQDKRFLRGFGYQGGGDVGFRWNAPGFGEAFKKALLEPRVTMGLAGFGECLPYYENFVEIDKNVCDAYGIPVLRIDMSWRENEKKMIPDMTEAACEAMAAAGAKSIRPYMVLDRIPGFGIHEMGVARMGKDKKTSVLNQFQQAHDVSNLFVMDAAGFTSGGCQNPTLTIMALTVRSSDYLLGEMKKGNL